MFICFVASFMENSFNINPDKERKSYPESKKDIYCTFLLRIYFIYANGFATNRNIFR